MDRYSESFNIHGGEDEDEGDEHDVLDAARARRMEDAWAFGEGGDDMEDGGDEFSFVIESDAYEVCDCSTASLCIAAGRRFSAHAYRTRLHAAYRTKTRMPWLRPWCRRLLASELRLRMEWTLMLALRQAATQTIRVKEWPQVNEQRLKVAKPELCGNKPPSQFGRG